MKMPSQRAAHRICVDCQYHGIDDESVGEATHRCGEPRAASMVDGTPEPCAVVRRNFALCGERAAWFAARHTGPDIFNDMEDRPAPAPRSWFR